MAGQPASVDCRWVCSTSIYYTLLCHIGHLSLVVLRKLLNCF